MDYLPSWMDENIMRPATVYLIRHAHAEWIPDENRSLSEQGGQDAQRIAHMLEAIPLKAIFSSDYRRAIQTVQPLAILLGLEIQLEPRFRERELGGWTALNFVAAVQRTWQDPDYAFPGGESNRQAQRRAILGLQAVLEGSKEQIVIGTHGNLLALILNYFDPTVDFDFWLALSMPDVYRLEIKPTGHTRYARVWM